VRFSKKSGKQNYLLLAGMLAAALVELIVKPPRPSSFHLRILRVATLEHSMQTQKVAL
jgi:hypothetical protein